MSTLWIREHMAIRKYSLAGTGVKSIVRIEVEVTDPHELGFFLRDLEEAKQATGRKHKGKTQRAGDTTPRKIASNQMLMIPYFGEDGQ